MNGGAAEAGVWLVRESPESARDAKAPEYSSPESLFLDQYEPLARALTLIAGDPEVAREAVQEAFARLCEEWPKVGTYEHQAAWVRRVAVNLVRDHQRSLKRRTPLLIRISEERTATDLTAPDDGDPLLWRAVDSLSDKQRMVVALHYISDLKLSEVAEVMHISEGSVKRHLDRARRSLRDKLEAE